MANYHAIVHKDAEALWSRLNSEFERYHRAISYIPTSEMRLQEDLRRYLCIRCAGFLEKIVFDCTMRYLESKTSGPSLQFAKSFFSHAPNLNSAALEKVIGRFGADHRERVQQFLTPTLRDTLDDLSSIRNPIAHGDVQGGRKLDPERYKSLCEEVYKWLTLDLLNPVGSIETFGTDI